MYVLLRIDSEFEFNVAKPMTQSHGYRFSGVKISEPVPIPVTNTHVKPTGLPLPVQITIHKHIQNWEFTST